MINKTAGKALLLSVAAFSVMMTGCGSNKATEAANESVETEKEGKGDSEAAVTEVPKKEEADAKESEEEEPATIVGVLFSTDRQDERHTLEEEELLQQLENAGYEPKAYYAENDTDTQINQIRQAKEEAAALVISPVDEYSLTEVLEEIKQDSDPIPVFAYDKLIRDTDAVNYYVTFDTRKAGNEAGDTIIKNAELEKARENKESKTIEFLMGSPDDGGALFFYNGLMESLQEYLDDGTLVCSSQKSSFDDSAIMRWSEDSARSRFEEIIKENYQEEGTPDIICTAYDGFASQVIQVLKEEGISQEAWPMITGVGAEADSVKEIALDQQDFTLFLDGRELAKACADMVDTYLKGDKPEVNDYEQYDNGKKIIGTYTCEAQVIDKDNYQILVDNGFYIKSQIVPDPTATPAPTESPAPTENPTPTKTLTSTKTPAATKEESSGKD